MHSKKAVTEVVLMIGVVLMAAVIISIGAGRIIAPLIKTGATFNAIDFAATVNTAYSAPEDVSINFEPKKPKDMNLNAYISGGRACIILHKVDIAKLLLNYFSPITLLFSFPKVEYNEGAVVDQVVIEIPGGTYEGVCGKFVKDTAAKTSEFSFTNKVTISKDYDEKTRKNSLRKT